MIPRHPTRRLRLALGLPLLLTACNLGAPALTPTPIPPTITPIILTVRPTHLATIDRPMTATSDILPSPAPTLRPTATLVLPTPIPPTAAPTLTPSPPLSARVRANAGGLRLRQAPDPSGAIILNLNALTPLNLEGRTSDGAWWLVTIPEGFRGWVAANYVEIEGDSAIVPVIAAQVVPFPTVLVRESTTINVRGDARSVYQRGRELGNRPNVFTSVGDSLSASNYFLHPFGYYQADLGEYGYLLPTLQYFISADFNSYNNDPISSNPGWTSANLLDPAIAAQYGACQPGENVLSCEFRRVRPSYALILIGTNDARDQRPADAYAADLRRILQICVEFGVVPILTTIPPRNDALNGYVDSYNAVLRQIANQMSVTVWDFASEMRQLPNQGLSEDGVHFSIPPDGEPGTVRFVPESLQYGMTLHNLGALRVLDAVRRQVGG
ncbi:MAG: GDSL-type esterase/lipase family protein [Anaerolineae bacterium]|nr:GDSL-type esterase/lipase family protein [Anaerolineae bacterium]MDW8173690.1 GDSL-type esterase/lipase family protein [Anaerolineae bacterium]